MNAKKLLGSNVRRFRDLLGFTQQELADKVGVESGGYISKIENGKKWPRADIVAKIAQAFQVKVRDLFDDRKKESLTGRDKMLDKWTQRFRALVRHKDEEDVEAICEFVKKMTRNTKPPKK